MVSHSSLLPGATVLPPTSTVPLNGWEQKRRRLPYLEAITRRSATNICHHIIISSAEESFLDSNSVHSFALIALFVSVYYSTVNKILSKEMQHARARWGYKLRPASSKYPGIVLRPSR